MLNLKIERIKKKMTQEELAEKIGVSRNMIGRYEAGTDEPTFARLNQMAEIFGVSVDHLIKEGE